MTERWKKEEIEAFETDEAARKWEGRKRALEMVIELCEMPMKERVKRLKDVFDKLDADVLCFDLKSLSPRQMEALSRLIDEDLDLDHTWMNGPGGTAITVVSKSGTSKMPPTWQERLQYLAMRLTS
jgi:hypothetical protein